MNVGTAQGVTFTDRVVIVTGAANGLGRTYARELSRRGAAVVVNDTGGDVSGHGASRAADAVVAEIRRDGGEAVASDATVATAEGGEAIVDLALSSYGRLDAVVNNAGILRTHPFDEMTADELTSVIQTHLLGSFHVSQPAFRAMRSRGYGRFVFTTSGAGLFGLRNMANYMAAKAGVAGLSQAVAIDGAAYGILSNAVAPAAITRMSEAMQPGDITPEDYALAMRGDPSVQLPTTPEFVTPMVVYLASEACTTTQHLYSASWGRFARIFIGVSRGWYGPFDRPSTAEEIQEHFAEINARDQFQLPTTVLDEEGGIREWCS